MKTTVSKWDFVDAFKKIRPVNFSDSGLCALFDYLEEYEESTGHELELDVVALCCDFTEYESLEDFQQDYSTDYESIEDIEDETTVIRIDDESFIIQAF